MIRKFALGCLLFLAGIVCLAQQEQAGAFWQSRDSNYNLSVSGGGGGGSLSLDGTATGSGAASPINTGTLTTAAGSGVIVACAISNTTVSSVAATGLTFTLRTSYGGGAAFSNAYEYTAPYTTNFSGAVTFNLGGTNTTDVMAFAIGNAKTLSYFDPNVALPATSTGGAASVTTSNAKDFIFGCANMAANTGNTAGTGWTLIANSAFLMGEYRIVSATQSGLALTATTGTISGSIADAIESQ